MSLELLQQSGVLIQSHEWFAEAGGQHENPRAVGTFYLHELSQLLAKQRAMKKDDALLEFRTTTLLSLLAITRLIKYSRVSLIF